MKNFMTVMSGGGLKTKSTIMNKHLSMETKTGKESSESPKEMAKERAISNVKMLIAKKRK
jgi:hypothetical protein